MNIPAKHMPSATRRAIHVAWELVDANARTAQAAIAARAARLLTCPDLRIRSSSLIHPTTKPT